jgi:hypothetical protein
MNELNCPACTHGSIAVCRFCIFTAGGPSNLCVRMLERYHQERAMRPIDVPSPSEPLETLFPEVD